MQQDIPKQMQQDISETRRERLLKMLAAVTFIIFFQGYMVAPIIPTLSSTFGSSIQTVGLIVPAYLIPYGIATLAYGILADRIGIHRVMFASLAAFSALTATGRALALAAARALRDFFFEGCQSALRREAL